MAKITMTFKTPDVLEQALDGLDEETQRDAKKIISRWLEYGEYITVEVDLKEQSIEVLAAK